jgi:WD40 repeat protein
MVDPQGVANPKDTLIARAQDGLRAGTRRLLDSERLKNLQPSAFLSMMCASAVSPVIATAAGLTDPTGGAVMAVLSGLGSGVVGGLGYDVLKALRESAERRRLAGEQHVATFTEEEAEAEVTRLLEERLTGGDEQLAAALSADIFVLFEKIDAGKVIGETAGAADASSPALIGLLAAVTQLSQDFDRERVLLEGVVLGLADANANMHAGFAAVLRETAHLTDYERRILQIVTITATRLGVTPSDPQAASGYLPLSANESPYRGLLSFREHDARFFYGRRRMAKDLARKVAAQFEHGGLIMVTGASGAGKSSLLNAGLLPLLGAGDQVPGSEHWIRGVITPGEDPLGELASFLAWVGGGEGRSRGDIRDALAKAPHDAYEVFREALGRRDRQAGRTIRAASTPLVLIVDQVEQVFTLDKAPGAEERQQAFITALHSAASVHGGPGPAAMVILSVRDDYLYELLNACPSDEAVTEVEGHLPFLVRPMEDKDLRLAITGPAGAAGLRIDDGLTDIILDDVRRAGRGDLEGVLPLLSVALHSTWELRDRGRNALTIDGYEQSRGVAHAVATSADEAFDQLGEPDQERARAIFCQLAVISRDRKDSRRPVRRAEIDRQFPDAGQSGIDAILEKFIAKRLIMADRDTVQLTHDVVLTEWPKLRGWLDEDRATLVLMSKLEDDVAQWLEEEKDGAFLYPEQRLATLQELNDTSGAETRFRRLTADERDFLAASKGAASRRALWRRIVAASLVVLLLATAVGLVETLVANADATRQRNLAISGQLAVLSETLDQANPVAASQLAAAAWQVAQTDQARESLLSVLAEPGRAILTQGGPASWVAFSPGRGAILASVGRNVQLWDAATDRPLGRPMPVPGGANRAVFSPDGTMLATADADGTVRLWDVATRRQLGLPLRASTVGEVNAVAFSPRGGVLATADGDGTARLWDVATRRQLGLPLSAGTGFASGGQAWDVAFSPDGTTLATASLDGTARLWDVATGHQIGAAMTDGARLSNLRQMNGVVFSPDGATLVTVCGDGTVRLWDVATRRQAGRPIAAVEGASDVAFGQHGAVLAVAENGGTVRLWDVAGRTQITTFYATTGGGIKSVAFSPDGRTLAAITADGATRLWDLSAFNLTGTPAHVGPYVKAAFSPDGRMLATGGFDGVVRLWDLASGRESGPRIAVGGSGGVSAVAFSPDGRLLATGDGLDGVVRLWDLASGRESGPTIVVGGNGGVSALAFSPNGRLLATGGPDGTVRFWDLTTDRPAGPAISLDASVSVLAFSPSGMTLATVTGGRTVIVGGTARLWNVAARRPVGSMPALGGVNAVAFSPDGTMLATGQGDGTASLWDISTGSRVGAPMDATLGNAVEGVAFSPDGRLLATAGDDGTARVWDVATRHEIGPTMQTGAIVQGVAFSADGATLATIGPGEDAALWDVAFPADLSGAVCAIAGAPLNRQTWSTYVPSAPYVQAC